MFEGLFRQLTSARQVRERKNRNLAVTEPNAPLLIRIVRDPYRQEVSRGRRVTLFESGLAQRLKVVRPPPVAEVRQARGALFQGNPIKALAIHPPPLPPPPSVDEWLATRGVR